METFADRLRAEIEYNGLLQKEVAFKAGIKKRALDMYLGAQNSMPPADVAVKLAKVLNVSVEFLVTGESAAQNVPQNTQKKENDFEELFDDLSPDIQKSIINLMKSIKNV